MSKLQKGIFLHLVLVMIILQACVEPYPFKKDLNFDRSLVVDGRLTNEEGTHHIILSETRPVGNEDDSSPVEGAEVWVEGTDGMRIDFTETVPGRYESPSNSSGVAGQSYQLFIDTPDGSRYESNPQELIASPPIDSVYDEYVEKANSEDEFTKGIQFFIDTHDDTGLAEFFKYEWEETYEVHASIPSQFTFFEDPDTAIFRNDPINICYASGQSSRIILGSTANLTESRLSNKDVRFITDQTDQLRYAYSIMVKQYVVSPEAYVYYRKIVENNESTGSLFDKQLGAIIGNIRSIDDPEEEVLGFFEVSGISKKRAFFEQSDLDKRYPWPQNTYSCSYDQVVTIGTPDSLGFYVRGKGYLITVANYREFSFDAALAPRYCADCRFRGPVEKPDFWIY